jgi:hypothetical protein
MSSNTIQWFENAAFDAPKLKSPQPCIHGAGCVYTVKDAEGKTVPGVCHFVHPGEDGRGRRLFPERTVKGIVQPECVRLIGGAGFYERMRLRVPWQAWCAQKGIPFTPNVPGVFRAPVKRVPIGASIPSPPEDIHSRPIRHFRTVEDQDFLITGDRVTLLKPEEAIRFGLRPPVSAIPVANQSWPVLGSEHRATVGAPRPAAPPPPPSRKPTPHPVVEAEVIAASVASVWGEMRRESGGEGEYESHESDYCDNCEHCGKTVDDCPEQGDHSAEIRELAEKAMLYYGVS